MRQPGQGSSHYGQAVNSDLLRFMGSLGGTVLDVGCGSGAWASELRQAGAQLLVGVEPTDDAMLARQRFDHVLQAPVQEVDLSTIGPIDVVVVADVLEHLVEPWVLLEQLRQAVQPGARLIVSVPNVRFLGHLLRVAVAGRFEYADDGGFYDRGHLRWFTQQDLTADLERSGWRTTAVGGRVVGAKGRALHRLPLQAAKELSMLQLHLAATAI